MRAYYAEHPDRLKFVPDEMREALGLPRSKRAILSPDASDEEIDAFVEFLKSDG